MLANNEGQGDPNDPSRFPVPRYVPLNSFDDIPARPDSSASTQSSSSGFASQVSDDGGVTLPPASVVNSPSHDHSEPASVERTGATNAQVHAPLPMRVLRNISIQGAAHANFADSFTSAPSANLAGPEVSASQPALPIQGDEYYIINSAAHANFADVFTDGSHTASSTAHRVAPQISTLQPPFQTYANGNGTGSVNIPKNDRIYGNLKDNRLSSLDKPTYGNGRGKANSRTYNNGIPRRNRRDNRVQGPQQVIAGSFGNNNAFATNGSRYPRVTHRAIQQYPAVNGVLFQESRNNQVSNYRASNNNQVLYNQVPNNQIPHYQASTNQVPYNLASHNQVCNPQVPYDQVSHNQAFNTQISNYPASMNLVSTYQITNYQAPNNQPVAYHAQIPHQTQFPTPLSMFNPPPNPFAAPERTRATILADFIRAGATDDGVLLDPDARTSRTGSDHRQRRHTDSAQFGTPTRSRESFVSRGLRHNGYGNTPSRSQQSRAMSSPLSNMQSAESYGIQTARTPATNLPSLLQGQPLPPPAWLREVGVQQPTLDEALKPLPFSNPFKNVPFRGNGVVKFTNIPYGTQKNELIACLGRNARPVNMPLGSPYYAVHIIMDRHTGKTGDAYIELPTARDALQTARAMMRFATDGSRPLKIGDREAVVQVSTPEELMAALFPHAGAVEWTGYTPRVIDVDTLFYRDQPRGVPFTGFCSNEELAMVAKFAESQNRSAFIQRTPYRLYECIISTLYRFPWHTPQYMTLNQRKKLYETVRCCIQALITALERDERERHTAISESLLQELSTAALSCVGFSELQKASFVEDLTARGHVDFAMGRGMNAHHGGSSLFSGSWPFMALVPQAFVDSELLKFYISLVSKASEVTKDTSLYDTAAYLEHDPRPFGTFSINYNSQELGSLTLEDVVRSEIGAVAQILSTVLLGGCSGPLFELE